jgi:MtN3 and saliva related transmembrane protein
VVLWSTAQELQVITTVVGVLAAIASTISFVPQAWRIVKARGIKSISTGMYSLTACAFLFWTSYGVLLWNWSLIVPNGLCLVMAASVHFNDEVAPGNKACGRREKLGPATRIISSRRRLEHLVKYTSAGTCSGLAGLVARGCPLFPTGSSAEPSAAPAQFA